MTLHDIESAVAKLPPKELEKFRAWFDEPDADGWLKPMSVGKADFFAQQALSDFTPEVYS
jgi:hypothetical protein